VKKFIMFSVALLAVLAFATAPVSACGEDAAKTDGTAKVQKASATTAGKTCSSSKEAKVIKASATTAGKTCSSADKAACAAKGINATTASAKSAHPFLTSAKTSCLAGEYTHCSTVMSDEECKELCGTYEIAKISVDGMTCGGCEGAVTAALGNVEGVVKVLMVDHKTGVAMVAVDAKTATDVNMTKAVVSKGFKAEMMPAIAVVADVKTETKSN
jgi:copper chaperone CopZ